MRKALLIGTVAVFIVWSVLDWVLHGALLMPTYRATASLWRPFAEIKMGVIWGTTLIDALCFTLLYLYGFAGVSLQRTLAFGLWFGLAAGTAMGLGTYALQPIPLSMALTWLLGTLVEAWVGALLLHWIYARWGSEEP